MTTLAENLEAMAAFYRGYEVQLAEWLSTVPDNAAADEAAAGWAAVDGAAVGGDSVSTSFGTLDAEGGAPEGSLAVLSRLEEAFIAGARVLGEAVEHERVRISVLVGTDLSLRGAANRPEAGGGGEEACNNAAAAIAAVARRRVEVLRRLEAFCAQVRDDRGKISAARRLGRIYYRGRGKGRRVDGHV